MVSTDTRILILGSLPGAQSLAEQRYYANPRNQFWQLTGAVIGREDLPELAYEQRLAVLRGAGIGLWDTIASAQRTGSLDSAIRAVEAAPLRDLVAALPSLRAIGFNGARSAAIGRKTLEPLSLIDLPSSSPAYATMALSEKRARWLGLADFL